MGLKMAGISPFRSIYFKCRFCVSECLNVMKYVHALKCLYTNQNCLCISQIYIEKQFVLDTTHIILCQMLLGYNGIWLFDTKNCHSLSLTLYWEYWPCVSFKILLICSGRTFLKMWVAVYQNNLFSFSVKCIEKVAKYVSVVSAVIHILSQCTSALNMADFCAHISGIYDIRGVWSFDNTDRTV